MEWNLIFFINSIMLGVGLAMDAFSVSVADGLKESRMPKSKSLAIGVSFGGFQALMPLAGYVFVHTIITVFKMFEKAVPWIALVLLVYLGIKMILEGRKSDSSEENKIKELTFKTIILQGIAVSIDALSVGFTFAEYTLLQVLVSVAIIAVLTFFISLAGILIGQKIGNKFSGKAQIFGGIILIAIGLEIFLTGILK
ncbi:MAG: manganese efflux pump MntP family protein [Lachnospiraceae bacterium]|nr:manganese efflux pump MntP family protein [Lachnospiraceae bacterium]